jgi:hypothetical protein
MVQPWACFQEGSEGLVTNPDALGTGLQGSRAEACGRPERTTKRCGWGRSLRAEGTRAKHRSWALPPDPDSPQSAQALSPTPLTGFTRSLGYNTFQEVRKGLWLSSVYCLLTQGSEFNPQHTYACACVHTHTHTYTQRSGAR